VAAVSLKPLFPTGISPKGRIGMRISVECAENVLQQYLISFFKYELPLLWGGQEGLI